jgi:ubiquinone/menaquinone biosynthesis C-methylase UbiE
MSLGTRLLRQCSRPSGWIGRLTLRNMNRRHAKVTAWGLSHVQIGSNSTILDVGCGGGMTIASLAAVTTGKVVGIDYSEESVATARRTNQQAIGAGRVDIQHGSVSHLPFPDAMFDLVIAVETHYYWPDLEADVREVHRVLKAGGTFAIIAEAYKGGKYDRLLQRLEVLSKRGIMQYLHLTKQQHSDVLSNAGYTDVQVFEEYEKGWLCAVGRRPGSDLDFRTPLRKIEI